MALPEHLAELERKVSERLSEALAKTRQEMRRAVAAEAQRANSAMLAELDAITPPAAPGLFVQEELAEVARVAGGESRRAFAREQRGAFVEFDRARTQASVLEALLASVRSFGDHAAIWLMRPTELLGWASRGFAGDPIAGRTLRHDASPALARLATGTGCVLLSVAEAAQISHALEIAAPARALFIPLVLRDRIAAALYVDAAEAGEFEVEALQVLTLVAAQRLELQALATRTYTPTLFLDGEAPASERGLALWDPTAPAAPATPATPGSPASAEPQDSLAAAAASSVAAAEIAWTASPQERLVDTPGAEVEPFAEVEAEEEPATLIQAMPTIASSSGREAPPSLPEAAAAEISWQMEESAEPAWLGSDGPAATPTQEIAFAAPATPPDLPEAASFDLAPASAASAASAASEWREVEEATAPHPTYSPAATQRFAIPAITHEIPQPEIAPPPDFAAIPISTASTIAFAPEAAYSGRARGDRSGGRRDGDDPARGPANAARRRGAAAGAGSGGSAGSAGSGGSGRSGGSGARPSGHASHAGDAGRRADGLAQRPPTEVAPPADLQGPGWAFSSSRLAPQQRRQRAARRGAAARQAPGLGDQALQRRSGRRGSAQSRHLPSVEGRHRPLAPDLRGARARECARHHRLLSAGVDSQSRGRRSSGALEI